MSGGSVWAPNNNISKKVGFQGNFDDALTYLNEIIGDEGPVTSEARKIAYIKNIIEVVDMLEREGISWLTRSYPDYYPNEPGGKNAGRTLDASFFDMKELGDLEDKIRESNIKTPIPIHSGEVHHLSKRLRSFSSFKEISKIGMRSLPVIISRKHMVSNGAELWLNGPFKQLIFENEKLTGLIVEKDGQLLINCDAVLLAAGGFSHNKA